MTRRSLPVVVATLLAMIVAAPSCREQALPEGRAERVVLVSYDGVGAALARQWIAGGVADAPDGLAAMAAGGVAAERLRMSSPTLTAVNHATLATGRPPAAHGIVSNTFRRPGTPIGHTVSGYAASYDVPALWTAAARQGVSVGVLLWPGVDAGDLDRMADFGIVWPRPPLARSEVYELAPEAAGTTGELISKDGVVVLRWELEVALDGADPAAMSLEAAAYDGNPDGSPRYDTVAIRRPGEVSWQLAGEREWLAVELEAQAAADLRPRRYVAWCKPLVLNRFTGALRLYRGAVSRLHGYPADFEDRLTEVIGPWPGVPDERLLADWWLDLATGIDLDTFLEQAERLDRYLDRAAEWVLANQPPRLLLAYHPTPDEYQHASLIVVPDQWAYTPGAAVAAREGLKRIGRSVDRSVAALWGALDPARDALVVVSDHGFVPIASEVRVLRALELAGLVDVVEEGGERRVAAASPMTATTSGGCVHLYLNLAGREPEGVVARSQATELLARAARVLADLEEDGRPAVERVFKHAELAAIGLDHPNAGDLVAFLAPGFAASPRLDGEPIAASRYYGQHGYLAHHDAMCGMLYARGAGIPSRRLAEVPATDVAPMVARWLGFELR